MDLLQFLSIKAGLSQWDHPLTPLRFAVHSGADLPQDGRTVRESTVPNEGQSLIIQVL